MMWFVKGGEFLYHVSYCASHIVAIIVLASCRRRDEEISLRERERERDEHIPQNNFSQFEKRPQFLKL